jgi:hypothetical protein
MTRGSAGRVSSRTANWSVRSWARSPRSRASALDLRPSGVIGGGTRGAGGQSVGESISEVVDQAPALLHQLVRRRPQLGGERMGVKRGLTDPVARDRPVVVEAATGSRLRSFLARWASTASPPEVSRWTAHRRRREAHYRQGLRWRRGAGRPPGASVRSVPPSGKRRVSVVTRDRAPIRLGPPKGARLTCFPSARHRGSRTLSRSGLDVGP